MAPEFFTENFYYSSCQQHKADAFGILSRESGYNIRLRLINSFSAWIMQNRAKGAPVSFVCVTNETDE